MWPPATSQGADLIKVPPAQVRLQVSPVMAGIWALYSRTQYNECTLTPYCIKTEMGERMKPKTVPSIFFEIYDKGPKRSQRR